ncbi:MAG: hypothetical protein IPO27_06565 [Bacteroidetes bacterium]|nr:hypothetical protein [Bacteroidota bacterium]
MAEYKPNVGDLPTVLALNESLGIVLYERDKRKKFDKKYDAPTGLSCTSINEIEFTSKDDAYFKGVLYNSFQSGQLPAVWTEYELIGGNLPIQNAHNCSSAKIRYRIHP